jgi:hypothetical protein
MQERRTYRNGGWPVLEPMILEREIALYGPPTPPVSSVCARKYSWFLDQFDKERDRIARLKWEVEQIINPSSQKTLWRS